MGTAVFIGIDIFMHSVDSTDWLDRDKGVNELQVSVVRPYESKVPQERMARRRKVVFQSCARFANRSVCARNGNGQKPPAISNILQASFKSRHHRRRLNLSFNCIRKAENRSHDHFCKST
jgi:hypothetical protein